VIALVALALLVPLFISQHRDVRRLREWMESDPDHPVADLAGSETILDRAEAELEELGVPVAPSQATPVPSPAATPVPAAARVTGERPALERITMERAALAPHPRWRRFVIVASRPRVLAILAFASVLVGVAAIVATGNLPTGAGGGTSGCPESSSSVSVAVLNGTQQPGLGRRVADDVTANCFELGAVTNSERPFDQTVVMFAAGEQGAAQRVAHALGVKPVQPIDAATQRDAGSADVVVIAGADRARS
jgi:LytR cell envelope-related transcriptional attenuator